MMKDYEYLFATTLQQRLKEKIVGKIFIKVTLHDELFIKIDTLGGLEYKLFINDFSNKILNGWTTEYAAYEVITQYKRFINERYFF